MEYLINPSKPTDWKIRRKALKYVVLDNVLYYQTLKGLLLRYLEAEEAKVAMREVHEGICGSHQSAHKMTWLLRAKAYWVFLTDDIGRLLQIL